jgi:hypothetical protein
MLLVYPPVAKPSEPPAGIAKISGFLSRNGIKNRVLDANLEGLLYLLGSSSNRKYSDTWSRRAVRNVAVNISLLKNQRTYSGIDRYRRAVKDLDRALAMSVEHTDMSVGLSNCQSESLSPLRSSDLIRAAELHERNPYYHWFSRRLPELMDEDQPNLIGFSLNYLSQALCTFAMAGYLKKSFPDIRIVLGGGLVTSWLRRPGWENPFGGLIDHLIAGPGEYPLLSLLCGEPEFEDAVPEYRDFQLKDYFSPGTILPYSGSSGCYWHRCSFCPENAEGNPYSAVPAERAMHEIGLLIRQTSPVLLHLLDNAISPALLRSLAENPPGLPWYGFVRIDAQLAEPDFCMALKRSGCVMLKLGIESGDQGVLDAMGKGIQLDLVSRVLRALKEAGIGTYVYLLFGTPYESLPEARRTLLFTEAHSDAIDFLNLAIFNMPVCSDWSRRFETNRFYEGDLSLYTDFVHPFGWDRMSIRDFLENEFRKNPAVKSILKKDPPVFTSNHAPFFIDR